MSGDWFTNQLLFDGVVSGTVFGLVAMGIVLVYRSTRVINFAVANLGLLGAGVFGLLALQYHVPFWIALAAGLLVGVAYGALAELAVIRRLFTAPRVIVLVATIGIAQLSLALLFALPEIDDPVATFPVALGGEHLVGGIRMSGPQLTTLLVAPAIAIALGWMLNRTALGNAVLASADNPDLARLSGISPKAASTMVWAVAGGLATLSVCLLAGQASSSGTLLTLGPNTLVRALAAAVIAGMASFPRAFLAGIAIGVIQAVISFNFLDQAGLMDFLVFLAILIAVYLQGRSGPRDSQTFKFGAKAAPIPEHLRSIWWLRHLDRIALVVLGIVALALPLVVTQPSRHLLYTSIIGFTICALSLTVLTGWCGQLSLGQMAFAGIGALLTAGFTRGINVDIGWGDTHLLRAGIVPLRFGPALALAVLLTAGIAALVGAGALRVRGLYLAVVTFAFAMAFSTYLFHRPILSGGFQDAVPLGRTDVFGIDVTSQRAFYYVALLFLGLSLVVVARLRSTGVGRCTIAVRDNPDTAAAYATSTTLTKLRAFALAGGLAALGGALLAANLQSVPTDRVFTIQDSLNLVSMAVIGGLGSVTGPILGALWVVGLPSFFPGNDVVPLLVSSIGLLMLLLYFPGGLVQIGYRIREVLVAWAERRHGPPPPKHHHAVPVRKAEARTPLPEGTPALLAEDIVVRYGGIVAVDGATIEVLDGEVVGLIGTNGAGKSTLMNAISGFVPTTGTVEVLGERAARSASGRARQGLGRSFQAATLFPELTVRETVAVALERRRRSRLTETALHLPSSYRLERARRAEAEELIDFLGLGRFADTYIADLSTGTRRIVELAGLLALDARVLCLDEPTAGVAQRETEAFGPLILEVRRELGASMLVIEHDMPLILSISDRVYCLERGRVIAEGTPAAVRTDPAVVASYLGTDQRAIARSGTASAARPEPVAAK